MADQIAVIKATQPALYRELSSRYAEAILAIEQDGVGDIEDAVDGDVEDEMFDLQQELARRARSR